MARCLRCGAGNEWLSGSLKNLPSVQEYDVARVRRAADETMTMAIRTASHKRARDIHEEHRSLVLALLDHLLEQPPAHPTTTKEKQP